MQLYWEHPALGEVVLEESWVLDLAVSETAAQFRLELAVTKHHRWWAPPEPGEQHNYLRAELCFRDARDIDYRPSGRPPRADAVGDLDLGNIDVMTFEADEWRLAGAWGSVRVVGPRPVLEVARPPTRRSA